MSTELTLTPLNRLLGIMRTLRDPQCGCPWDLQQTWTTIAPHTLEEAYEVVDAIRREDFSDLREELGDLLFQVVFFAQLGSEQQHFNFDDICHAVSDKLERRHPHIFANQKVGDSEAIAVNWEKIKSEERVQKEQRSALDDIPLALPALMRAQKIQKRCSNVGFDWPEIEPVMDKVHEELREVMDEVRQRPVDEEKLEEEIGDLLFATVNLARHLGKQAETSLQKANDKFERRFRQVEQIIHSQGMSLSAASLQQMEAAWQQVKRSE